MMYGTGCHDASHWGKDAIAVHFFLTEGVPVRCVCAHTGSVCECECVCQCFGVRFWYVHVCWHTLSTYKCAFVYVYVYTLVHLCMCMCACAGHMRTTMPMCMYEHNCVHVLICTCKSSLSKKQSFSACAH